MRESTLKRFIELARLTTLGSIVSQAIHFGEVRVDLLKSHLKANGYYSAFEDGDKRGVWAVITKGKPKEFDDNTPNVLGKGFAENDDEALVMAVMGMMLEEYKVLYPKVK